MNKNTETKTCRSCGESVPVTHTGACPHCGKEEGWVHNLECQDILGFKDSLSGERRREFFEENPKIKWVIYAVTFGSPILGFVLTGLVGVFIGSILGVLSYLLGPYATIKVREIEHWSSNSRIK